MHFHLPKPLHGWREFVGEVGIIVIGVLIALSAEQLVESIQTREDVRAFRETIDHEIGLNMFMYDVRARAFACDTKRVAELNHWLDQARSGAKVPAIIARGPTVITPYRSAWDNRNAQVFNHLPADVREKYAEFYDELTNNWATIRGEEEDWGRLGPYREAGPITLGDRRTIRPIISKINSANEVTKLNLPISRDIEKVLKVKEIKPDNIPADWIRHVADCPSVIAAPGQ